MSPELSSVIYWYIAKRQFYCLMIFDNDYYDDENGDGGDEQNIFNLMIC